MKIDWKRITLATIVSAAFVVVGCSSHDEDGHGVDGGHASAYPSCEAITNACHEFDTGEPGPITDCHATAHGAKSESDCAPVKDSCVALCAAQRQDAGNQDGG